MSEKGGGSDKGCSLAYLWETGDLFLKTKQALEEQREITVEPYAPIEAAMPERRSA